MPGRRSGARTEERFAPAEWSSRLIDRREETPTVGSFSFSRPDVPFSFQAGQYLALRLPGVEDPRGDSRTFSISSAPSERDRLTITTRRGPSPFKQRLFAASVGVEVRLWGAFGTFVLDRSRPSVMVGGGIGITPFRSMLLDQESAGDSLPRILLYSSRVPEEIVYQREFEQLALRWESFRWAPFVTRPLESRSPWEGATGHLNADRIRTEVRGLAAPVYYVCGPPAMVRELHDLLVRDAGIPARSVRMETFQGY